MGKKGRVLSYGFLAGALVVLVVFLHVNFDSLLDYDTSSEMILAQLLSEEGGILSENWYYSTELRVLNTQLVFAPLFKIFSDWHVVRMTGTVILYAIMLACIWYFCRKSGLGGEFPLVAAVLFLPVSDNWFCYVLGHTYYIPHICISMVMLGLLFSLAKEEGGKTHRRWHAAILTAAAGLLSVAAGMGGLRQLLIFYIPMLLCSLIFFVLQFRPLVAQEDRKECEPAEGRCGTQGYSAGRKSVSEEENEGASGFDHAEVNPDGSLVKQLKLVCGSAQTRLFLLSCGAGLLSAAGYLINKLVLSKHYWYNSYEELTFTSFNIDNFCTVLSGFLACLGYRDGRHVFSLWLPVNAIAVCLFAMIVFSAVDILRHPEDYTWEIRTINGFFVAAVVVFTALYSFSDMGYKDRYNLPILMFAVPVVAGYLRKLGGRIRSQALRRIGLVCLCGALCLNALANYYEAYRQKCIERSLTASIEEIQDIAVLLENGNYTVGYGTISQGNTITELTDGYVEVIVLEEDPETDLDSVYTWLQRRDHATLIPEGKVFCLFSREENETYTLALSLDEEHILYESENYVLYGYESYEELIADAQ